MSETVLGGTMPPVVRRVAGDAPWVWLGRGWSDLWRRPALSLGYGLVAAIGGALLAVGLAQAERLAVVLPLAAGFMIVGPMLAVGLYEMSRRYESGQPFGWRDVVFVATRSPVQLALVGGLLAFFLLAWLRIAALLFALFHGAGRDVPPFDVWFHDLFFTIEGVAFMAVGCAVGGALAILAFAMAAVSVPLLLARDIDVVTAVLTSIRSVTANPGAMLVWAWLILLLVTFGMATLFVGLIITFPLVGHATWHAYRDLVGPD